MPFGRRQSTLTLSILLCACGSPPPDAPRIEAPTVETPSATAVPIQPAPAPTSVAPQKPLDACGESSSPPYGKPSSKEGRECASAGSRQYKSKYATIAHRVLDIESEVCGVPDSAYQLLDDIIEQSDSFVRGTNAPGTNPERDHILRLNRSIANLLTKNGYALYVPVRRLADALVVNSPTGPDKHLFDCDTGSFLYMSIAEHLGLQASLVDTTRPSGSGHTYVRWVTDGTPVDWDVNQQAECTTPETLYRYQGVALSTDEVMSYVYGLRGYDWKDRGDFKRARADFDKARSLAPGHPSPLNFIAWLIATTKSLQTPKARKEALELALEAVDSRRIPDYLDTLACAYAINGDFPMALKNEEEAIEGATGTALRDYKHRYELMKEGKTCVGQR